MSFVKSAAGVSLGRQSDYSKRFVRQAERIEEDAEEAREEEEDRGGRTDFSNS